MFNFFEQLANVELEANPVKEKAAKTTATRIEKNPTNGADFRIMATGKIYPSEQFVKEFNLEYTDRNSNIISNGFDLFPSNQWGSYKNGPDLLLGYAVAMTQPKVELFAGVRYNEEGHPINSVMDQGTALGDETLELIATSLGYSATTAKHQVPGTETIEEAVVSSAWNNMLLALAKEGEGVARYVDFYVVRDVKGALTMPDGIYNIPKTVARGEKKGTITTVRREKVNVLPVIVFTEEVAQQLNDNQDTTQKVEGEFTVEGQPVEAGELVSSQDATVSNENATL